MDPKLQNHIGQKLRNFYDQIAAEPVPDRFKALLDRLESAETNRETAPPDPSVTPE